MSSSTSFLGRAVLGGVAGAAGTLAMDLLWYSRYRRGGGEDDFASWEFSASTEGFDDAGAPAQVGKRLAKAVTGKDLPDDAAGTTNNVVHWATGVQWGALHGLFAGARRTPPPIRGGLKLGPIAWGSAYALLGAAGVYQPIWEYDAETLTEDLSAHLVFGVVTSTTYRILAGR